jgi:hypothetical protein
VATPTRLFLGREQREVGEYYENALNSEEKFKNEVLMFSRDKYTGGQQAAACRNSALVNN